MELLALQSGVTMTHVPYKGTGPALADLMGGHVDLMFANVVAAAPLVKSGKLRALAASTARRSPSLPEVRTVAAATGQALRRQCLDRRARAARAPTRASWNA